ncbi:MAG: twin-arginine translocase TatA/TatE family subunit [Coriobacteriia bacterium]|nr:twin-arginine translocase TatA/TatE family subunit [Coriobacteriia bacterium]
MFGIGGTELVIVAVVALLLFGPDKLPQIARTVGRFMRDFKRYQDMMESTIRAEMYASQDDKPDPFKKGKDFREKVQAQRAEVASGTAKEASEASEASETPETPEEIETPVEIPIKAPDATAEMEAEPGHAEGEGERSTSDEV